MTATPIRREEAGAAESGRGYLRPALAVAAAVLALGIAAVVVDGLIEDYRDGIVLRGLGGKPSPVDLIVAGEPMTIPANMIRFRSERRGGAVDRVNLLLHWPSLEGFSEALADDFKDPSPAAPLIFVTIAARDTPLDAAARLKAVYARFFEGPALSGPAGLVGRRLAAASGYRGEVVYYAPEGAGFVARCLAEEMPEIPATCIRDVNVGEGLSMLYRFNAALLADWRAMDAGLAQLATRFVRR
jgi:hypothetical protein